MPLLSGANFCVACGTSVRAGSKVTRARNRVDDTALPAVDESGAPVPPAPVRPSLAPTPEGVAPQDAKKTGVVVAAVAATILVAGIVGQAAASAAADEQNPPTNPIELDTQVGQGPETDPAPEPVPAPGPTPDPSEEPTDDPTDEPSATSSSSRSLSTSLGDVVSALDTTGSDEQTDAPDGTTRAAGSVDLGGGIGFEVPEGYEVAEQAPGFAMVAGDGGLFFAIINPAPTDLSSMVTENLNGISGLGIQDLQYSDPQSVPVPSSAVVECAVLGYIGVIASQQGGTIPVEGFAYYFVLQDGTGVTAFTLYEQGALGDDSSPLIDGYNAMFNSLISTF
jgi:hypothetical protein